MPAVAVARAPLTGQRSPRGLAVRCERAGDESADRRVVAALERAGAGLVARFLTSGEAALTIDLAGSGLPDASAFKA